MRARRMMILLLALTVVILGAVRSAERGGGPKPAAEPARSPTPTVATPDEGALVRATLPDARPVRASPSDTIELRIRSATPDVAKIVALGVEVPVGPGLGGIARFGGVAPGRYDVRLNVAQRTVGTIDVARGS